MPQIIKFRRSATAGSVPPSLLMGELGLNVADKDIYYKSPAGPIVSLLQLDCGEVVGTVQLLSLWRAEAIHSPWHWSDC